MLTFTQRRTDCDGCVVLVSGELICVAGGKVLVLRFLNQAAGFFGLVSVAPSYGLRFCPAELKQVIGNIRASALPSSESPDLDRAVVIDPLPRRIM
ncbi:MAG: hypothetical protein HY397_02585 [Candidatus Doudnabacteria bacterium]|nr:hypothetical protein [Candidatus Doudnabacteria bacterium]